MDGFLVEKSSFSGMCATNFAFAAAPLWANVVRNEDILRVLFYCLFCIVYVLRFIHAISVSVKYGLTYILEANGLMFDPDVRRISFTYVHFLLTRPSQGTLMS